MVDFGNSWSSKNSESPLVRLGVSMDPLAMLFPGLGDWKVKTSDKLQGWVSKNIAKNDPFIKLERKYGPSHWFSELRPISDWALEKPLDATALTVGAVVAAPYAASAFGSGAGGAGGAGMWEGAFGGTTGLSGATYGAAPASGIPGIAGTIGGSTGAAAGGLSAGQMAGLGATALGAMSPQQQQGAAMAPPQRQGNRFSRAMQAFPGAISGALFPTQPGVDASVSKAAQDQAMMAFAAGLLAGRDKPGASFGGALGNAYLQAQQSYGGAMDNAFRNTLIRKQEEREERSEDREVQREKQAQRQSAATTAGKLATGLQNSAGNMPGYWQMVAGMPEVQGAVQELGLQPPTELDPGSWQQFQQKLAGAAQVGAPAVPRQPVQLKAIVGPKGKPILVPEELAIGQEPAYAPKGRGVSMTMPDGTVVEVGGDAGAINAGQLSKPTINNLQETIVRSTDRVDRLNGALEQYKPEFLRARGLGQAWTTRLKDFAGMDVSEQDRQFLTQYASFQSQIKADLSQFLNDLSGAAISEHELTRLKKSAPSGDELSPAEFESKARATIKNANRAIMRANWALKNGIGVQSGEQLAKVMPLEGIDAVFEQRANEIWQQMGGTPATKAQAIQRAKAEFGLAR